MSISVSSLTNISKAMNDLKIDSFIGKDNTSKSNSKSMSQYNQLVVRFKNKSNLLS